MSDPPPHRWWLAFWGFVVWLVSFVVLLVYADTSHAHLAHEGTSDGPDRGSAIQLYKLPGTEFGGQFQRARHEWNAVSSVKFHMVYDPLAAEVIVYKRFGGCEGDMRKWDTEVDSLWATTGCDRERLHAVMLHELGHVLDLEHHSCNDYTSVMNMCARVPHLTLHDRLTLKRGSYY